MSSDLKPLDFPAQYKNGKPLEPYRESPTLPNIQSLINPKKHPKTIIGMFSDSSPKRPSETNSPIPEPEKSHDNDQWLRHLTQKFAYIHTSGGVTLFADNKIEIRPSPNSLSYIIINPELVRYVKIIGPKLFFAEKTPYGFSEITYEYHQNSEKNKEDMVTLLRYIVYIKMLNNLSNFSRVHSKLFIENIEEQIEAIKYTYPIVCLFSYGTFYEFYLCDASYENEASLSIKLDNDLGFTNIGENQQVTLRISVQYAMYTLYLMCKNMPKNQIIVTMNKLFQAINEAKNHKHFSDATKIIKKSKVEIYVKN